MRSGRDYLPRWLTWEVGAAAALLIGLLGFTSAIGSADDLGAVVVLVGLVVAGVALASVTRRPRQGEHPGLDDALRRQVATGVIAAVGLLVTVPLVGVGTVAAAGLLQICAAPAAWTAVGTLLIAVVPLALVLDIWCAAVLVVPGRVRAAEPARL